MHIVRFHFSENKIICMLSVRKHVGPNCKKKELSLANITLSWDIIIHEAKILLMSIDDYSKKYLHAVWRLFDLFDQKMHIR